MSSAITTRYDPINKTNPQSLTNYDILITITKPTYWKAFWERVEKE